MRADADDWIFFVKYHHQDADGMLGFLSAAPLCISNWTELLFAEALAMTMTLEQKKCCSSCCCGSSGCGTTVVDKKLPFLCGNATLDGFILIKEVARWLDVFILEREEDLSSCPSLRRPERRIFFLRFQVHRRSLHYPINSSSWMWEV